MKILSLRWGYDGGGVACGPLPGSNIAEVLFKNDAGEEFFVLASLFTQYEHVNVTRESVFDLMRFHPMDIDPKKLTGMSIEEYDYDICDDFGECHFDEHYFESSAFENEIRFVRFALENYLHTGVEQDVQDEKATADKFIAPYVGKDSKDLDVPFVFYDLIEEDASSNDKQNRKKYADELSKMQKQYNVTWDYCRTAMIPIGKKYDIGSVFALTKAEDIWRGLEKCLYGKGRSIHFSKHSDYPCIRAKQIDRCLPMFVSNGQLHFMLKKMVFGIQVKDRFQTDEVNAIMTYMKDPQKIDQEAIQTLKDNGYCIDTYRPCYVTLVPKIIRGRCRIYVHLTIEGKAKPKYKRNGDPRHKYGKGIIGADIGTQTVAYTSDTEVGLKNLAERGNSIRKSERLERLYYRAMDRSRRATNPQCYNSDGTLKKGRKRWHYSNHYKKLKAKHAELCRVNAINRQLAINEDANHLNP